MNRICLVFVMQAIAVSIYASNDLMIETNRLSVALPANSPVCVNEAGFDECLTDSNTDVLLSDSMAITCLPDSMAIACQSDFNAVAVPNDTIATACQSNAYPAAKFIVPAVLISYGALAQAVTPLKRLDENIVKAVDRHYTKQRLIDDYLAVAPFVAAGGMNLLGVKASHNFRDRTFVEISSLLIVTGTVQVIKRATGIERPDGSNNQSFPSGHTALAFAGAHILFKEYKDISPWIGIAGYATATTVGAMRILNRKHRLSDVVAGAGVGILSTEVSYLLLPVFHRIIGVKENESGLVIAPMIGNNQYGVGMVYLF